MNEPKAIIVDLDGVLWDGSCHAGLSSIKVNNDMVAVLSSVVQKGLIVASLSANHSHIAEGTLTALGVMQLFADWRFDFNSKEKGMESLLDDLHILPANVVYIDDTPFERELIKKFYPAMLVLDVRPGFKFLKALDERLGEPKSVVSAERTNLYRQEKQRRQQEQTFASAPAEFLKELGTALTITWNVGKDENLIRIEEMFSRNHQFNSASVYYSLYQLQHMIESDQFSIAMVEARDKYGSYGICGCLVFAKEAPQDTLFVSDLTFSCRVQRPHIIDSVLCYVIDFKRKHGFSKASIRFFPTEHNFHLARVFDRLGLKKYPLSSSSHVTYQESIDRLTLAIPPYVAINESIESIAQPEGRIPFIYNQVEEFYASHRISGIVLDVGSGSLDSLGKQWYDELPNRIEGVKVIKVDIDPRWEPDVVADARELSQFETGSIDIVMCLETLEHMEYFWKAIDQFLRVLKINGHLILSAPLNFEIHGGSDDFFRFTPKGLRSLIENAGREDKSLNTRFQVERVYVEGDPIYPTRTFIISTKV